MNYARRTIGIGWVHTTVDSFPVGNWPSLAYDRYERPAISYWEGGSGQNLRYARFDGSTWLIETPDSLGDVGLGSSIAFDLLGRPAISYHTLSPDDLKYISDTDGDLSLADEVPETVSNVLSEGFDSTLVFNHLNQPMISHSANSGSALRISIQEPGVGWITTTVVSGGSGGQPSIAIDPVTGHPAISYFASTGDDLRYAAWDGTTWNITTIDSDGVVGEFSSLAFDPADGNPAVSYYDRSNGDLKLAWHDGNAWQTQPVDTVGDVGFFTSLAFNNFGTGFPSISYADSARTTLYYIEDPAAVVPEPGSLLLLMLGVAVLSFGHRSLHR